MHSRARCLLSALDMRGACPVMIVMPGGETEHVGIPVEAAFYQFLHREFRWQPRRLKAIVASGRQDEVELPHVCGE